MEGKALFRIAKKLNIIKAKIKSWNKEFFGDIFKNKIQVKAEIKYVQDRIQEVGLTEDLRMAENDLLSKYHSIISNKETFWRQRSKALFLKEGDKNTCFFHLTTLKHRAANRISRLNCNKDILTEDYDIRKEALEHFSTLLGDVDILDFSKQNTLLQAILSILSEADNHLLSCIPSNLEIKKVVFSFQGDKSPGPDDFPMFFFQNF